MRVGGGIGGRTVAYGLLSKKRDQCITMLEANDRLGGCNHAVRNGDTVVEEADARGRVVQTCMFKSDKNALYRNTGPGRIHSSH